jgi:hypothetical protein
MSLTERIRMRVGTPVDFEAEQRAQHEEAVRNARLEAARRNQRWTELEEVDLVSRQRGLLVSASTDRVYRRHLGAVFAPGSVSTLIADQVELYFYVTANGEVVFLEPAFSETWSEYVTRRERRR